jgi:hypothetical protein
MAKDEEAELQTTDSTDLITEEQDDTGLNLALPTYNDVTDDKVLKLIRDVFTGFTFDSTADYSKQFQAPEQLAQYMGATLEEIRDKQQIGAKVKLANTSAALGRFWCMGSVVNNTLEHAAYGNGACTQIAKLMGKSVPYVYQIRAVATQLSLQDCFLLGMRDGCSTTTLRRLAQIKDKERCKQIIKVFIDETQDMSDAPRIERATKAFKLAINEALKHVDMIEQDTTNPTAVGEDLAELVNASYAAAMEAIKLLKKETKKIATEETVYAICDALGDFAITEAVPDAEEWLRKFKEALQEAKDQAVQARSNIDDILTEVESALRVEVLTNARTKRESSN